MQFQGMIKAMGVAEAVTEKVTKQTIVVEEMEGQYPQSIAIDFINDKVELLKNSKVGDVVKVSINTKTNESSTTPGKFFTSINGWKLDVIAKAA